MNYLWVLFGILLAAAVGAYAFFAKLQNSLTGNLGLRRTNPTYGRAGDNIEIHSFFTPVGSCVGSVSPFTNKIEAFLRFSGLPYQAIPSGFADSPNGRVSKP